MTKSTKVIRIRTTNESGQAQKENKNWAEHESNQVKAVTPQFLKELFRSGMNGAVMYLRDIKTNLRYTLKQV